MKQRFTDKVVLITGGASGIGLVTARAFAKEGAKVVIADLSSDKIAEAVAKLKSDGADASGITTDVTDYASCEAMVDFAVNTYGNLHIAFNNAAIPTAIIPELEDIKIEDWDHVIKTNLSSVFYSMKAEVSALKASGGTAIVNTASVASFIAGSGMSGYVASKHGVAGLTKSVSIDLIKHGIRVNAVCPGVTDTPMLGSSPPEVREAMAAPVPIKRIAQPEEIAEAVLFLASESASYMVGSLMVVDGGLSIP